MFMQAITGSARRMALMAGALILAAQSLAAAQDISDLAPQRTFAVVSVPNWAELARGFEGSSLGKLWEDRRVQAFVDKLLEDETKDFKEFLEAARVETRDLKPPAGQVGIALFLPEPDGGDAAARAGLPDPHLLAVADLGEHTEAWEEALERLIDHGLDEKRITIEDDSYAGNDIRVIKPIYPEVDEDDDEFDWEEDEGWGGLAGLLGGSADKPRNLYIVRIGAVMIASTDLPTLEVAIDSIGGKKMDVLGDTDAFRSAAAQRRAGAGAGELAYGLFFPKPFLDQQIRMMDQMPGGGNFGGLMQAVGIGNVQALSLGLRLNTDDAASEISLGVLMPQRTGLLSLLMEAPAAFEPPAFVSPDAADITSFNIDFPRIPEVLRSIFGTFPEEQRRQILGMMDQFANIINPTFEAMGPEVHYITTYRYPLGAESEQQTVVVQLRDQQVVSNTVDFLLAQAPGMVEPREFEGNMIYSDSTGMVPLALGIGFNRLFVGSSAGVENAMRMAGRADGGKLGDEPRFRDAVRPLSPGGVVYSFTDVEQTLRWTYWEFQNELKIFEDRLNEFGDFYTDEQKREIIQRYREDLPKWVDSLPPIEIIREFLGDSVTELHAIDNGFRGRTLILRPRTK
jgi:hypothetical protein